MVSTVTIKLGPIARGLDVTLHQVQTTVELLDEGNTVPFITRYRKDHTGGLDEEQIREIQARLAKMRLLADRKQTILRSIESQGKLTEKLTKQILATTTAKRLEYLYLPYKPKKQTLATVARSRGLKEFAHEILEAAPLCADLDARAADFVSTDRQVPTAADALLGAGHILAEHFSEQAELRQRLQDFLQHTGVLISTGSPVEENPTAEIAMKPIVQTAPPTEVAKARAEESPPVVEVASVKTQAKQSHLKNRDLKKKKLEEKRIKAFRDYFDYRESLKNIPPHRILAINRGERAQILRVRIECDFEAMAHILDEMLVPPGHPHADYLRGCARDALTRLIVPSLERDIRRDMTDWAESHAVGVFAKNLRNLLLQPPVHNHRLLAVDPGFKSGCKLAALDQFGNLLDQAVIFLVGSQERREEARKKTLDLIQRHQLTVAVVGNGTACRETEDFFAELIEKDLKEQGVAYVIVNEAGASVYSISQIGRDELPDCDATLRGAISIGRRLQDPLSELVKIDPASIGVGLYQHDVKAKHLRTSLDDVVESCVNFVGVDVNIASPALLRYVSGLNQLTARRLYEYRCEHGPFSTREQLRQVPGLGEATFVQAAGFLKISAGDNPLDATWIHPESYAVANRVLERLHGAPTDLREKDAVAALAERVAQVDLNSLAKELEVGELTLKDILAQLARPGRDPREDLPSPVFKRGIIKLEDLVAGMELTGTVLNVVDFGCFVDIGMHDSGLVHVSRLADRYISDPHDLVAVGDIVKVWVIGVDKERRRASLTMVQPGTERPKHPRHVANSEGETPANETPANETPADDKPADKKPAVGDRPPRRDRQHGHDRPPRRDGQRSGSRPPRSHGHDQPKPHGPPPQPKPRPKPIIPITEAMKEGKEPLRTFGDLVQFYQHKEQPKDEPADGTV